MHKPVYEKTSQEAIDLLDRLYRMKGRYSLTGQHNYIGESTKYSDEIQSITGKTPLVWGSDFGFSNGDDKDSILFRENLLSECLERHKKGHIVVLSYHQGNPAMGEPCPFLGGVQSPFSASQWEELLEPRTVLNEKWKTMMDILADFLKKLESAHVPVVFRPYHEMNGDWFWWGGEPEYFKKLWIQTYRYFTDHHSLSNLLWAWCSDKPWEGVDQYYPGGEYVDIVGCDIYPEEGKGDVYPQVYFDRIEKVADGKILALTENSVIPDEKLLERQPWSWFMGWSELTCKEQTPEELKELYSISRYKSLEDLDRTEAL